MSLLARFFFLMISVVLMIEVCAEKDVNFQEKMYISQDRLDINSNGIFVNIGYEWYQTRALFSDEQGFFIPYPQENGCRKGYVPCRNCDRCVWEYYNICPLCNRPV